MASTPLLGLSLPADGTTNWGTLVNTSITALLDSAVAGTTTLTTDADVTLSTTTEAANQARQAIILCTGSRAALRTITAPAQSKTYIVINATTGSQSVKIVGVGPTTGITVPSGKAYLVAWNGSDFVTLGVTTVSLTTDVSGVLPVANGGTGQTTYTDGQLLIGNTSTNGLTKATLSAGSGVSISNGGGSITISATGAGGTVTSVSFTGGIVSVANPTTTPALTIAGTSGGVPYFSSGTAWASSAALAANAIVLGGGAGAAPATTTTGTGVVTALGNNANSTGGFATINGTATLTNKRIDPRVSSTTSTASITPDIASFDQYCVTAQAAALAINAPTGTPVDGNKLIFRLLDNGVSRAITWNGTYTVIGVTLPTTTTASKTTYVGCIYNAANTRWDVIAVTTQA